MIQTESNQTKEQLDSFEIKDAEERITERTTEYLLSDEEKAKQIIKLKNKCEFFHLTNTAKDKYQEDGIIRFYINKSVKVDGKIINKVKEHKQKITLCKVVRGSNYQTGDEFYKLFFFNEKIDKRLESKIVDTLEREFYLYNFVTKEKEFLLIAEEDLDLEEYIIEGSLIEIQDYADIGNYSKISLKLPIIFLHTAKKRVIKYENHQELFEDFKSLQLTEEKLMSYIFSNEKRTGFRFDKNLERLCLSFLFSAKYDSNPYPLHLLIIGDIGGGKSTLLENLYWKFEENQEITDGSTSTLKSLIPSFKSPITIKQGDLLLSKRICAVDEFFRILMRVRIEERENQLTTLNPLLEHRKRNFGSGNSSFKGKMGGKLFAVTNPVRNGSTMDKLCNNIDTSFLSRMLIYYQSPREIREVRSTEEETLKKIKTSIPLSKWISLYDYLQSFKAEFDIKRVSSIFEKHLKGFPADENLENVKGMYTARYKHHLKCLLDGIIKIRCLCENAISFKAKEEDYLNLESIWVQMLKNWGIGFEGVEEEKVE